MGNQQGFPEKASKNLALRGLPEPEELERDRAIQKSIVARVLYGTSHLQGKESRYSFR